MTSFEKINEIKTEIESKTPYRFEIMETIPPKIPYEPFYLCLKGLTEKSKCEIDISKNKHTGEYSISMVFTDDKNYSGCGGFTVNEIIKELNEYAPKYGHTNTKM